MSHLRLEKLTKSYSEYTKVIESLDLQVNSNAFVVIVGPSGCGKSI
ncbi:hypothetical protein KAM622c_11440 [Klebsiella quasipneumoniae subsp. quasipneumoniae]|nr:hypothetical protein KAM622c_11440 [Klebsiella quasipneumoniae subsp. quasipneumoniae]